MFLQKKNSLGIDIANRTIEAAQLSKKNEKIFLAKKGRVELETGIVEDGKIKDSKKLKKILLDLLASAKIDIKSHEAVFFGLPEDQLYTHTFQAPQQKNNDYEAMIRKELSSIVPLENDQVVFNWIIEKQNKIGVDLLAIAAEREIIKEWQDFFKAIGASRVRVGSEMLANFEGMFLPNERLPICLVDIGAATTKIGLFDQTGLKFSSSLRLAGEELTREMAKKGGLALTDAEREKQNNGLLSSNINAVRALQMALKEIAAEIKNAWRYGQKELGMKIKSAILIGGTSQLPGLIDFFQKELNIKIEFGQSSFLPQKRDIVYLEAIGLALAGLDEKFACRFPIFQSETEKDAALRQEKNIFSIFRRAGNSKKDISEKTEEKEPADKADKKDEKNKKDKKPLRRPIITLGAVAVAGAILISLAFCCQNWEHQKREKALWAQLTRFTVVQTLTVSAPVAVNEEDYAAGRVQGCLLTDKIILAGGIDEAISFSFSKVNQDLSKDEYLWPKPISAAADSDKINKKKDAAKAYTIVWLIFNKQEANRLLAEQVDNILKGAGVKYALNNLVKNDLKKTDNQNLFTLSAEATVALEQALDKETIDKF